MKHDIQHSDTQHHSQYIVSLCRVRFMLIIMILNVIMQVYVVVTHLCVKLGAHLEAFNINKIAKLK